ncbi:DUF421 domain-containing protein [Bacillus badius]|uniref:DUF421 domain-containing protein n=1 Tax=Bacillus badius TaxID=1455 RepID=A0ABR5AVQ0_BACBA|nr:DUF421 domain-containing protein [Bacillus badius]KIL78823.1 hypothetical protein SD77_3624 [Bacillus badius]MED4717346.1 DUF421 domain-containing protein [Bacillus badius]
MAQWLEVAIRSISFLTILFIITKIIGKRQIAQLSFFEYIAGITIGSIVAEASLARERSIMDALIAIGVWGIIPMLADYIAMKSKTARSVIEGHSTVFIKDGKVLEENLKKEKYTIDELLSLLRKKDIFSLSDVEYAVLEQDGNLNALLKKDKRPLTRSDLQMPSVNEKEPYTVIMDGHLLVDSLAKSGKTKEWLDQELEAAGVTIENVFIGQINSYGELYIDLFDDQLQAPAPQERPLLLANLKKLAADMEIFALATDCEKTKKMYERNAADIQRIIQQATPYLSN